MDPAVSLSQQKASPGELETPGNLSNSFVPHGITRHIDGISWLVQAQQKACHFTGNRLNPDRPMTRRRTRYMKPLAVRSVK
jgi:hypothetical protein